MYDYKSTKTSLSSYFCTDLSGYTVWSSKCPCCLVQVSELQRSLKASQAEQQEALERSAAAVTLEQKAVQDSLLQVH